MQGLVLLRKGAESLPALKLVQAKIEELNNTPGRLPPGVQIEPFYDRTDSDQRHDRNGRREPDAWASCWSP